MSSLPSPHPATQPHGIPVGHRIVARTVELDVLDGPRSLLSLLPDAADPTEICSWVRRGEGLVGWGRALELTTHGPERFSRAQAWWRDLVDAAVVRDEVRLPGTGPVAFGSVSYAAASPAGAKLVVPEVVVGARDGRCWVTTIGTESELPAPVVPRQSAPREPEGVAFADGALSPARWAGAVAQAVERITAGDLDKVVLARDLRVSADAPIDPR
ncbi:MAG TPA: isochorismate synthase, partial [Pedococcus sp.]|nr:isochorismate synthase [Pedococcus sp.]